MAPPDIQRLDDELDATERDAEALVAGVGEEVGGWRAEPGSWSIAECLDHIATGERVYLDAMRDPAARARAQGRQRRRPAEPGLIGGWFARMLEPPVKPRLKMRAPRKIRPRQAPALADAFASFKTSHTEVRDFLRAHSDLDLAGVLFPNPFIRGIRFSLATGLHVLTAHARRHLWQAWRVRQAAERTDATGNLVKPARSTSRDAHR
jgi:hypothetical protein